MAPFVVDFSVDTTTGGFEDYTKRQVRKLEAGILDRIDSINNAFADQLRWAYSGGIVQRRTGAAADSVKVIPAERDSEYITGSVQAGGPDAPEVEILEFGSKPHVIYPKDEGGTLSFIWNGNRVFLKYVFHPGTKAYGIFEQIEEQVGDWESQLQDVPSEVFG